MQSTPAISQAQATVAPQQATNIATINPPNAALKLGGSASGSNSPSNKKSTTNLPLGRGVPPPIPPNKPIIPPKREGSSSRLTANGSKEAVTPPVAGNSATGEAPTATAGEVAPVVD